MLNNIKKMKAERGFTIVELLIVIVVIAILAAIIIVAYNGIQNRAKSSAGQTFANAIMKKAEAYNTLNSSYPTYCQLVTNSKVPTGTQPANGTLGVGSCVAGGGAAGDEAKLDSTTNITPAATDGAGYTGTISDGNKNVAYFQCAGGADVFYWDYAASSPVATAVKAGAGCP